MTEGTFRGVGGGDEWVADILERVSPYTMVSTAGLYGLCLAVDQVVETGVPGAIVECGVWRGGSAMAAALTLARAGAERDLVLFDTFEGMTPPTDADRDYTGKRAADQLAEADRSTDHVWAVAGLDEVQANVGTTGYERVEYVAGDVLETVPARAPEQIALLRLDTDWYESTKHELVHLYPRVPSGGIVIIDDYGHWSGARRAVDEYFAENGSRPFLSPLDYTGRLLVVP